MKQYTLEFNTLNLKVKKSPFIIRFIMFLLAFLCFVFPVLGVIGSIASEGGMHIGYFFAIGIFGLIGFLSSESFIVEYLWRRNRFLTK